MGKEQYTRAFVLLKMSVMRGQLAGNLSKCLKIKQWLYGLMSAKSSKLRNSKISVPIKERMTLTKTFSDQLFQVTRN